MTTNALSGLFHRLRKRVTGVERSRRYYDRPHRVNVVLDTDGDRCMSSHMDARAWKLTADELLVEQNARRLNEDPWRSYDRDRIVRANVTTGETIIPHDPEDTND